MKKKIGGIRENGHFIQNRTIVKWIQKYIDETKKDRPFKSDDLFRYYCNSE